jgi:glycosyltransferase involved in cell wall biosynthesis
MHYTKSLYSSLNEEKEAYNKFNNIIFVSHGTQAKFECLFGTTLKQKSKVVYNPINIEEVIYKSKEIHIEHKNLTFCAIGRLTPQKGFDRLLDAAKKLNIHNYNFNIWIIGEGNDRYKLTQSIYDFKLDKIVHLLGFQKNPYPYIKAADVFICSSRAEGFSLVLCEALVLKKHIISVDCVGAREIFQNGNLGTIVDNSTEGIYQGMESYLREPQSFHKQALNSSERYAHFDQKSIIQIIENLFDNNI